MPVLPIVDLLILLGSGSLFLGFILKAISIATLYRPTILGFTTIDFVLITGVCFGFALTFVARTWLKLNEPGMLALKSRLRAEEAQARALDYERRAQQVAPQPEAEMARVETARSEAG